MDTADIQSVTDNTPTSHSLHRCRSYTHLRRRQYQSTLSTSVLDVNYHNPSFIHYF